MTDWTQVIDTLARKRDESDSPRDNQNVAEHINAAIRLCEREMERGACTHPPERRTTQAGDPTFYPREGCLSCNKWLQPWQFEEPMTEPKTKAGQALEKLYIAQSRDPAYQRAVDEGSRGHWSYTEYDFDALAAAAVEVADREHLPLQEGQFPDALTVLFRAIRMGLGGCAGAASSGAVSRQAGTVSLLAATEVRRANRLFKENVELRAVAPTEASREHLRRLASMLDVEDVVEYLKSERAGGYKRGQLETLDRCYQMLIHNCSVDMVHPARALSEDGQRYVDRTAEALRLEILSEDPDYDARTQEVYDLLHTLSALQDQHKALVSAATAALVMYDRYCADDQSIDLPDIGLTLEAFRGLRAQETT